ncbi:GNAT family N-acetyltransferase [Phenylobacterium terrae]|uniref:GNAT family N-acetyltransferase n=1 Tax=Phenylobacterium terrae TaxID=2665495 RepID=A0ABW4MVT1_9CAUL
MVGGLDVTAASLASQQLGDPDIDELLAFMSTCSGFFELVKGYPPEREDAAQLIQDRPEGLSAARKLLIGLRRDGGLVGVLEVLQGYPDPKTWYLGLLLLDPKLRGGGLGAAVYAAMRRWAAAHGARRIQLVVQEQNPSALAFWRAMGFREIGRAEQTLRTGSNRVLRMAHDFG